MSIYEGSPPNGAAFQFASTTCQTIYAPANSSTAPLYAGGFTYGEIVVSVLLFVAVVWSLYAFLWLTTKGVRIRQ